MKHATATQDTLGALKAIYPNGMSYTIPTPISFTDIPFQFLPLLRAETIK